ncbi:TPA: hypothetical protein HA281_02240 [Candidatus Woesearchaeota archaeon]|nr:hypothetical protein [Candidatus Woesearchaeota archaeon]HII64163.1 hypothetical protein [Candidatus Woesearchaeota archaeon]HIJ18446.1 hypothetical protein [Candidatus Woesearchaeota archaeon]
MPKRSSYEVDKKILMVLKEGPVTYAKLERKVNTGFRTIKSRCEHLETLGSVKVKKIDRHPATGRPSFEVSITGAGMEALKRFKERSA